MQITNQKVVIKSVPFFLFFSCVVALFLRSLVFFFSEASVLRSFSHTYKCGLSWHTFLEDILIVVIYLVFLRKKKDVLFVKQNKTLYVKYPHNNGTNSI